MSAAGPFVMAQERAWGTSMDGVLEADFGTNVAAVRVKRNFMLAGYSSIMADRPILPQSR